MNSFTKITRKQSFKFFAIFLLVFSMISSSFPVQPSFAQNDTGHKEGHGSVKNDQGEQDYDEATINKEVTHGNKPGEYFIDLTVKGKEVLTDITTDIVIVYDNSNSMDREMENGETRAKNAKEATTDFLNGLSSDTNTRFALITYGSSIFDGQMNQTWANNPGITANHSYKQFTNNTSNITDLLPSYVPSDSQHRGKTWHGGTFTQQALVEAGNLLSQSNADRKFIVTVTDGAPTLSYINGYNNNNYNIRGDGTSFTYEGDWGQPSGNHGTPTINTANELKQDYDMYAIGLGLEQGDQGAGASAAQAKAVVEGISSTSEQAYITDTVPEMIEALKEISSQITVNSIVDGSITDPITDEFLLPEDPFGQAGDENLENGEFFLSASDERLLEGVTVRSENQHILVDGLNLGKDDWVKVRYKIQIDTENPDLDPEELYKTNGTTTLTPDGDDPDNKREFPEPEASAEPIKVSGKKAWVDWGYDVHRPDEITLQLIREINGEERIIEEVVVQNNGEDVWEYEFKEAVVYDNNGERINYLIREIMPEGTNEYYIGESGSISGETTDVRNIFQQDAKIQLVKTAQSTSDLGEDEIEVGKDINYTFEITNIGNLPLKDITLEDELDGISDFTFETLNGDPFTGDIGDLVLQPGDVLVATASYKVTQGDFDHGQVNNHAEVVGTPTVPEPDRFGEMMEFDDTPVKDDDDASVPGNLDPSISLTKTADKEKVSEVGEEVEYSFEITNTGDTTLTEIALNDPMLGGNIALEVDNLLPGESTTITVPYEVTQEDIDNGEIVNEADVEGTPPPAYTENPDNPDKVTDEDDEIVETDQSSAIELVKEADKEGLTVDETVTYTFTATNTGNTTLTNVEITDDLVGLSAIEYLTVNGDPIADVDNITLEPGDVLVAEATYVVTQDDVNLGQVYNEATVTGKDPKDEEVTDEDDVTITEETVKGIELVKTSDKEYVTEAGQEIEYSFDVTNTGNVTLTDVIVKDPMLGEEISVAPSLAPGETVTVTETYTVTQEDIDRGLIENIATATGTPPNPEEEPPTSPPAKDEVPVAKIDLEKSVLPIIYIEVGQELTYVLVVTNTGEVTLNEVTLTDDMLGGEITLDVDSLEPGESTEVEVPYTVTEADVEAGEIVNTAEVEGTPEGYDPEDPNTPDKVHDEDDATANYAGLIIEKTSDKEVVSEAGEEIVYSFTIENIGTTVLEDIVVNDEMLEELGIEVELEETTLAPGESTTGTATYTVTQEDIDNGGVYNVATTTGTPPGYDPEDPEYPDEPPVSPPSEEYVPSDRNPDIELVKFTETDEYTEVGQEILYTFTVTNTGNTTLENVSVYDETFDVNIIDLILEGHQGPGTEFVTLAPGESATGTYTHTVTQEDLDNGEIHNLANTEGTPPPVIDPEDPENPVEQDPVTDEDDELVEAEITKGLSLEKEADKQEVSKAGDEITYTLTVTNTGNVTLEDVTVNDEMLGGDLPVTPSTLAPGETGTVTGTYVVTQEDIDNVDKIVNIATATGTPPVDPEDPPVTPPVEEEVPVVSDPEITLVKQADVEKLVVGETVTYTFTATNTGNTSLEKVNLVDKLEGLSEIEYVTVNGESVVDPENITLKPGDVLVAQATYEVTQADFNTGVLDNHATVEGTPPPKENPEDPENPVEQDPVTDEDDESLPGEHVNELILEKDADKEVVSEAGEIITYKFTVTNTGNTTLTDVRVDDPMLEELGIEVELEKTTLEPGESTVGYAEYVVTQEDIDNHEEIVNIATATGTPPVDPEDPPVSPPVEEEVPVVKDPSIELEKVADREKYVEVGEEILYTFTVTNTGNVTLTNVKVDDETFKVEVVLDETTLAPGESTTGTYTYTVTQEDLDNGEIHNFANTEGTPVPVIDPEDPDNPVEYDPVTDEDDELVEAKIIKDLALEKVADEQYVEKAGDTITYTLTVTNTGNVTLEDVTVNDEMLGGDLEVTPSTLAPGESGSVTGTYVVTQEDIDNHEEIVNIATATGTPPVDPEEPPVTPPVEEEVPVVKDPSIELEKVADREEYVEVGEEIVYTFTVTNTGNVTLTDVKVYDETFDVEVSLEDTTLAPGESTTGTYTYTVTQEDLDNGEIHNFANTEGTPVPVIDPEDPDNPVEYDPVTDEDDELVEAKIIKDLALEKVADEQYVEQAGDTITYTLTVTNTGNVTLEDVTVNDEMLGGDLEVTPSTLAPGESGSVTGTYVVTQEDIDNHEEIVNIATATGTPPVDPEEPPVTPPVEEEVPVVKDPSIELEKVADREKYAEVGEEILYTFTVTNTGNVTLTNVKVDDETFGVEILLEETTLAPGESTTGTYTYAVTQEDLDNGEIHNQANAEGTPPPVIDPEDPENPVEQDPVTDEDDEIVETDINKDLELEKVAHEQYVEKAGDTITYTLTVTNTGNVTLEDVTVNDEMLGGDLEVTPSTLAPGESGSVTGTYVVTQEDIDNHEEIVNIATATGTPPVDPEDPPVTPPVEEEVPVEDKPEITLVKQADQEELVVGETITYTFTATNTGTTTLENVNLVDELDGLSEIEYVSVNGESIEDTDNITLAPGDVLVATATYEVTQEDVNANELYNHAVVEGTPPPKENPEDPDNPVEQDPVTDDDDTTVPSEHKSGIIIEKTANKELVEEVGEVITYKFVVTNTGNVTLENVKVDDPMLNDLGIEVELEKTTLVPGESTVGYADYTVTQEDLDHGSIYNVATGTGTPPGYDPEDPPTDPTDPGYPPVSPPSEVEVPAKQNPDISLEKLADKDEITKVGEQIVYTFTITNTGNVTLENLVLNDPMLGGEIKLDDTSLEPGESTEVSVTYEATEEDVKSDQIVNVADVTATTETGEEVSDEDQVIVDVNFEEDPGSELPKTATNMYNYLLIGAIITLLGLIVTVYARRRTA